MTNMDVERELEQQYVDKVTAEIKQRIERLQQDVLQHKSQVVNIRKDFWDDVTVNVDHADDIAETVASMKQQAEVLSEQERNHRQAYTQLQKLMRLVRSPFFGRVDFVEQGQHDVEPIYIGLSSFLDDSGEQFLVYDWRAPVSSLYYDYSPGHVEYVTPTGTMSGTMDLKRQYFIRDGLIRYMFDTGVTIGDELLREVLGQSSDTHMKSIVATIQKEQNQIIRNDRSRMLIVQGAAGSGKTSAALQRVAYLLYKYRGMLQADQIVLFSPNPMFNSYVSTVLPELGEENMQQTTFQEYLDHRLGRSFQVEDPFTQMEVVLQPSADPDYMARTAGIRYKASVSFLHVILQYHETLNQGGLKFKDIRFRGRILVSAKQMTEQFYTAYPDIRFHNRIALLTKWLLKQLEEAAKRERTKKWVQDEIQLLSNEEYQRAYNELQKQRRNSAETFDDYQLENEMLSRMLVNNHFKTLRKRVKMLRYLDIPGMYRQLFADPQMVVRLKADAQLPGNWGNICEQTVNRLDQKQLAYEDATPLLFLKELIEGFQTNNLVRHVFVDEAQDYSPFQFEFLKRLFPRSKMTVLGDLNQAIFAHASELPNLGVLESLYGTEETVIIQLTRSYRSTREIVEFTRHMIPGGESIVPFNRSGLVPTVQIVVNRAELHNAIRGRIEELQQGDTGSIAIICKTAQEAKEAYDALQEGLPIKLVTKDTASFEKGLLIVPSYLAKGVEFDVVIIYNASKSLYGREEERKLFYTACTRAMHRLHIYAEGELAPFVADVDPALYVRES